MSGLVLRYKNGYAGLLVLHLLPLFNPSLNVKMLPGYIFSIGINFGRCSSELAQLVPLPYCRGSSTHYSDRLHYFSDTIPRCYKGDYVNSFFPRTARLVAVQLVAVLALDSMLVVAVQGESQFKKAIFYKVRYLR